MFEFSWPLAASHTLTVLSSEPLADCVKDIWVPILTDYREQGLLRADLDLDQTVRWLTYQYVWFLSHPDALTDDPETLAHYIHTYITGALIDWAEASPKSPSS